MVLNSVTRNRYSSKPHHLQCGTDHHPATFMKDHGEDESHYGLIFYCQKTMLSGAEDSLCIFTRITDKRVIDE